MRDLDCTCYLEGRLGGTEPPDTTSKDGWAGPERLRAFEAFAPAIIVSPGVSGFDFFDVDRRNHRTLLCLP